METTVRESQLDRIERIQAKQKAIYATRPDFERNEVVVVKQPGIKDQVGVVKALKWNGQTQSWYADVWLEGDDMEWVFAALYLEKIEQP